MWFSWQVTWSEITADLISACIGGLVVFLVRDHAMRALIRWWHKHAGPSTVSQVHEKVSEVHELVTQLREHLGNGYLDDVHAKLDNMESKFRTALAEDVVPLLVNSEEDHR
jgi:hypothetical protein